MFEVHCLDLETKKDFNKIFWDKRECDRFVNKCNYSTKIRILSVIDNSKFYD